MLIQTKDPLKQDQKEQRKPTKPITKGTQKLTKYDKGSIKQQHRANQRDHKNIASKS